MRALLLFMLLAATVRADPVTSRVDFAQKLGAQTPLDAAFRDENAQPVRFGDYLGKRPAILVLGYSECPMLCSLVLNGVVETLNDLRATTGTQFDLIDLSIDPKESPSVAASRKRTYFKRYYREGADAGWHFLTGQDAEIHRVADAIGFHYAYDPESKQYAHASGFVVLTPEGKVSRYFFGVTFDGRELQTALNAAAAERVGSPIERLLLLCFHTNPIAGKYGALILGAMRVAGMATLSGLGLLIYRLGRAGAPVKNA